MVHRRLWRTGLVALAAVGLLMSPAQAADHVQRAPTAKIVNGQAITVEQAPWQVALLAANVSDTYNAQFCGGSIVDPEWIVTAAHCVVDRYGQSVSPSSLQVLAGVTELATPAAAPRLDVSSVKVHPSYNGATQLNDIALLKLSSPLTLNGTTVGAIDLPHSVPATWPAAGTAAFISGWGNVSANTSSYPTVLQAATIDVLTSPGATDCGLYPTDEYINTAMLCAGTATAPVKDTCQGDSGGPLAVNVSGTWTLAGITSWGYGCANASYPGVYTRVTTYTQWVFDNAPELSRTVAGTVSNVAAGEIDFYASCQDVGDAAPAASVKFDGGAYSLTVAPGRYRVRISGPSGTVPSWHAAKTDCDAATVVSIPGGEGDVTADLLALSESPPPTPAQPSTPQPSQVAEQAVASPARAVAKGKRVRLSSRTVQGQSVTWTSRSKKVCTVSNGMLRAKKKGFCRLRATAAGTSALDSYRRIFVVRIH